MPRVTNKADKCHRCKVWYPDNYLMKPKHGSRAGMVWWCRTCGSIETSREIPGMRTRSMIADIQEK
jgi:hypothetical protein